MSPNPYVAAMNWQRHQNLCSKLFSLSTEPQNVCSSPITSLGISTETMVLYSFGLCGTYEGKMFLIILDAYSMNTLTSNATIGKLCCIFVEHGLPDKYAMDKALKNLWSIMAQNISVSYHQATNGQTEWAVQSFKDSLKKKKRGDIEIGACKILLQYSTTFASLMLMKNWCQKLIQRQNLFQYMWECKMTS